MIDDLIGSVLFALLLSAKSTTLAEPSYDAESNQFVYIDEMTNSAEVWNDGRKFWWLDEECDFQSPCGFGAIPVESLTGTWRLKSNASWRLYKENYNDGSGTKRTTGLGYRSYGADETFLMSDPLPCIYSDSASLRLKVRFFGDSLFRICFVSMKNGKKTCGTTLQPRKYGYSTYNLDHPMPQDDRKARKSGHMFIRLEFIAKDSSFVFIEKISYVGQICIDDSDPRPTQALNFTIFKENADTVSVQNVIAVLLNNDTSLQLFVKDLPILPNLKIYHACQALRCHSRKHLCLYDGLHGASKFLLSIKDGTQEQVASFNSGRFEFAIFASAKFFDRRGIHADYRNTELHWRFKINDLAIIEANVVVCFFDHTFIGDDVAEACVKPRLFKGGSDGFSEYLAEIPQNAFSLRLLVWRRPGPFKSAKGMLANIVVRAVDVQGCEETTQKSLG